MGLTHMQVAGLLKEVQSESWESGGGGGNKMQIVCTV